MNVKILDISYFLPCKILTNAELKYQNPDWNMDNVANNSGVIERRIAGEGETAFDLTKRACESLFSEGGPEKSDIDAIIFCTQSEM